MGHLIDYVEWKGDESYSSKPFNLVDSVVLAFLSYVRFGDSIRLDDSPTLKETYDLLMKKGKDPVIATMDGTQRKKDYLALLQAVCSSSRYGSMVLVDYEDITDTKANIQFAGLGFKLETGELVASYRGTDETIVGWKENFELSFQEVPAQRKAAEFATKLARIGKPLYIVGHSKGGNLALYAASKLPLDDRNLLKHLYLLDSPGLCEEVFGKPDMDYLNPVTTCLNPGYDVVGQIFKMPFQDVRVVDCDASTIFQHAFLSWRIEKGEFVYLQDYDPECAWANQVIRDWLIDVDMDSRKKFVGDFFQALTSHGEKTLWDLGKNPIRTVDKLLVSYFDAPKKTKEPVKKLGFAAFFGTSLRELKSLRQFPDFISSSLVQALIMITVGLLFTFLPESLPWIVVISASAALLFLWVIAFYYLAKNKWNWKAYRLRLWIASFLTLAYVGAALLGWQLISDISLYGAGLFFLLFGAWILLTMDQKKEAPKFVRVINWIEIALYALMGCYLLFVPTPYVGYGLFAAGIILTIDGAYKLVR